MAVNIYDELDALKASLEQLSTAFEAVFANHESRLCALEAPPHKLRLGVVSYFRPSSGQWEPMLAAKPALTMINPGSGPGPVADAAYPPQVAKCRAAGVPVYGYVHTRYSARAIAEVKADIDLHVAWYGIDGIFVDTVSTDAAKLPYYRELCDYIHAKGLKVCLNPGTAGPEEHAQMADYVVVTETYWSTYRTQVRPAWEAKYPGKLFHIVHTCPAADMPQCVNKARADGAGLLHCTDDVMPNPFDKLPTYFAALAAAVN